jgi:hypothetical protein
MPADRYEPNRFLGMPQRRDPHARRDQEPQRVMGIPLDWFSDIGPDNFRALVHPIREYRRWLRRRRLGLYAIDDDERGPKDPVNQ